jgi:hypothetical protein
LEVSSSYQPRASLPASTSHFTGDRPFFTQDPVTPFLFLISGENSKGLS